MVPTAMRKEIGNLFKYKHSYNVDSKKLIILKVKTERGSDEIWIK